MHELGADGSAIDPAGFLGEFTFDTQFGMRDVRQETQRIKISFEISPVAERLKNAVAIAVGSVQNFDAAGSRVVLVRVAIIYY